MKRFAITGHVSASKYLGIFEAETAEDAIKLALESEEACVSVCNHCSDEVSDPEIEDATADEVNQ